MKDLDPLPYRYKHILGRIVPPGNQVVETSKLISSAFDDMIYSFIKPFHKVFGKYKIKKTK
jgi:hypothetical protein